MPTMDQIYNADKKRWIAEARREDKLMVQKAVAKVEKKLAAKAAQDLESHIERMINMNFSKEVIMDTLNVPEDKVQIVIDRLKAIS
jgi:DNA-binding transcriptional regulator YhcF (GntR family)